MGQTLIFSCTNCKYKRELLNGAGLITAYKACFCYDCHDLVSVQTHYEQPDATASTFFGPGLGNPFSDEQEQLPPPPLNCCPMCRGTNIEDVDLAELPSCPKCKKETLTVTVGALWE